LCLPDVDTPMSTVGEKRKTTKSERLIFAGKISDTFRAWWKL